MLVDHILVYLLYILYILCFLCYEYEYLISINISLYLYLFYISLYIGQAHRITEDYVNMVGDIMYPKKQYGPFGYDDHTNTNTNGNTNTGSTNTGTGTCSGTGSNGRMTLSRVNSLGFLTNPLRKRRPIEHWSPYELSIFEAAMMLYGKNFNQIHKHVSSISCIGYLSWLCLVLYIYIYMQQL